eukprot:TRINITY_DN1444_c0_g3_i2.p1 TRINITY_DN1444_c0_g3~~TRINITY_DN1444_c0_g3_i2.p1  ORF type:complete len:577 (+),score=193.02 TRINITY_DN1444_c0_g3_i2:202-1932(+)
MHQMYWQCILLQKNPYKNHDRKMNKSLLLVILLVGIVLAHPALDPLDELLKVQLEGNRNLRILNSASSVSLVASPSVLIHGSWVAVQIKGVKNPDASDVLAMYSPADSDVTKTSPIRYFVGKEIKGNYLKGGEGFVNFTVINMHSDVSFSFFSKLAQKWDDGSEIPKLEARSNTVRFANQEEPNQGHIALTGVAGEMKVMWASGTPFPHVLRIGQQPGNYSKRIRAIRGGYNVSEMCASPAKDWGWKEPGTFYSAVATNLKPGTRYYYSFGSEGTGYSKEESFVAPAPASRKSSIRFVAFGDLGKGHSDGSVGHKDNQEPSIVTVNNIHQLLKKDNNIDLVYHVGDISYARGYSYQWDEFMDQIRPVASKVPWMTLPGNHEIIFPDAGGECGVAYQRRFLMPHKYGKPWYSFEYGPVHFTTFSTEHDFSKGSEQWKWIANDLKSVNRSRTPWVVFSGHRPMYYLDPKNDVSLKLQKELEPLLDLYKVEVALWGHVHNYQRICSVHKGECKDKKTTHVVVGMGGFNVDKPWDAPHPSYVKVYNNENGYSIIQVDEKKFNFQYFNNQNVLKDSFVLTK